jgi:hypothetical protein
MTKNIHIPEGMVFRDYVRDSLNNALENGDDEFLASLEQRNAQAIANDMLDLDAGVSEEFDRAEDDLAFMDELRAVIREWCEENRP